MPQLMERWRKVRWPMGMRNKEPRITGVAMTMLIWVLDNSYSTWNRVASGDTRPHTAKHRVKESVASTRALYAPARGVATPTELILPLLPNRNPGPIAPPDLRSQAKHAFLFHV